VREETTIPERFSEAHIDYARVLHQYPDHQLLNNIGLPTNNPVTVIGVYREFCKLDKQETSQIIDLMSGFLKEPGKFANFIEPNSGFKIVHHMDKNGTAATICFVSRSRAHTYDELQITPDVWIQIDDEILHYGLDIGEDNSLSIADRKTVRQRLQDILEKVSDYYKTDRITSNISPIYLNLERVGFVRDANIPMLELELCFETQDDAEEQSESPAP
jgi:hypothetical protein